MNSPIFPIVGYTLLAVLHGVGIVLLYKAKRDLPNQRVITLNLAVAEFLFCVSRAILYILVLIGLQKILPYVILNFPSFIFFLAIRFAIFHIIVDRFLNIWLNIKYPILINTKSLIKAIICQWILSSFLSAVLGSAMMLQAISSKILKFTRLAIDIIIVVAAGLTFVYLFMRVKNVVYGQTTVQRQQNRSRPSRPSRRIWLNLKIPILMVSTYMIFNTSSSVLWFYLYNIENPKFNPIPTYYTSPLVLDLCGWCSDGIIYIFLQKRVRHLLVSSFRKIRKDQVGDVRMK